MIALPGLAAVYGGNVPTQKSEPILCELRGRLLQYGGETICITTPELVE